MSLASKILLGLIFVANCVFFYMAINVMRLDHSWRSLANRYELELEPILLENQRLELGGEETRSQPPGALKASVVNKPSDPREQLGIHQLNALLSDALTQRGRVWKDVQPGQIAPNNSSVSVTVDKPDPHQINDETIVYLFDQSDRSQGGEYLGEFKVSGVSDKTIVLTPLREFSQREVQRLASAVQRPWVMYEVMPVDQHDIFITLDQDEIGQLVPAEVVADYVRNGKPAEASDPPERVADGRYMRALRDYNLAFRQMYVNLSRVQDSILALMGDVAKLDSTLSVLGNPALAADDPQQTGAIAAAYQQQQVQEAELARLKTEGQLVDSQRDALVKQHETLVAEIARLLTENQRLADEITVAQRRAVAAAEARAAAEANATPEQASTLPAQP